MSAEDQTNAGDDATAGAGSADASSGSAGADPGAGQPPSEEELRERLEEEVRNLRVQDVLLQSIVSIINLSARRIVKEDERDLEQAQVGIEAVRRLVDLVDGEPAEQVRQALSEVQLLYAKESGAAPAGDGEGEGPTPEPAPDAGAEAPGGERRKPPGLWTPPGT